MNDRQELKVKSLELAIALLGVLTGPKNSSVNVDDAALYIKDVDKLALEFEELIMSRNSV